MAVWVQDSLLLASFVQWSAGPSCREAKASEDLSFSVLGFNSRFKCYPKGPKEPIIRYSGLG